MKVLLLNDYLPSDSQASGAERFTSLLHSGLKDSGIDVNLMPFYKVNPRSLLSYDVIHVNNYSTASESVQRELMKLKHRVVITFHDYLYLCPRRNMMTEDSYICPFIANRAVCKQCCPTGFTPLPNFVEGFHHVFPSENMAHIYAEHRNFDHVVIHHGIPFDVVNTKVRSSSTFLYASRIHPEKGVFEMLAAFRGVNAIHPSASLVLTRTPEYRVAALLDRFTSPSIRVLNTVPRYTLDQLYAGCLAVVAPSIWQEPFNLTILEAFSSSTPVLASKAGAHPELVDQGTGLLHDPFDYQAFEENMCWALEHPEDMAAKGIRGYLKHRGGYQRMIGSYLEVYSDAS